ncbi:MAG: 4Fe-4S dicluster domain-containing protein [Desulfobulbaceae bacterium]|nr:4Fe-4S dicluster domain-containing protein [Desulfobulbaceae bacterium]
MNIKDFEKLDNEGAESLPSEERRKFLRFGLTVTGVFLGGTLLSLTTSKDADAVILEQPNAPTYPYKPHYSMVILQNRCIDCERCMRACEKTNKVPSYGFRTKILEQMQTISPTRKEQVFMPVLCNHCNRPPCVRVCPTSATYKNKTNGIVMMDYKKCIGCKTCMAACPYSARYFKEENRAIDKCNFCFDTRLSKGETLTACANACPAGVRNFGDISDPDSKIYHLLHRPDNVVWVLRPETGTLPNVFYSVG